MMQRAVRFLQKEPTIWGPVSLLCTLAFAVKTAIPFDLLFVAAVGFFLSARMQIRGCCYAFVILGITAAIKHTFLVTDHLWLLGIEGSLACAFFITALGFEQGALWIGSLQSQMETRNAALENLEEEHAKMQQAAQEQQIAFQEKVATLQKELEEIQIEHSSILILNEVLRKTTARHISENESLMRAFHDLEIGSELIRGDYEASERELKRLKNTDAIVLQNGQLIKELNQARYEKEQTHLINETLARLHFKEVLKAKEADQEAASLQELLSSAHQEVQRIAKPLEEELKIARDKIDSLEFEYQKTSQEANRAREHLLKLNEIQTERNFLRERLQSALDELSLVKQAAPVEKEKVVEKIPEVVAEELEYARAKILHLSQIEPLFRQLKKQFEEKNHVLHQARSDLFKTDAELQKLKIEKAALELNPLPKEVEQELEQLTAQILLLEEENRELQDLVTILTDTSSDAAKRKKKVKTESNPTEQTLLF